MEPDLVAAIAAAAAALISLVNIFLTAKIAGRQEGTKWTRELLPDLVRSLDAAYFKTYMALFNTDWRTVQQEHRQDVGMPEFALASELSERLEVFASPSTVDRAREVAQALSSMRFFFLQHGEEPTAQRDKWPHYWAYAEASFAFVNTAREEMGLKPLSVPPGLLNYRQRHRDASSGTVGPHEH